MTFYLFLGMGKNSCADTGGRSILFRLLLALLVVIYVLQFALYYYFSPPVVPTYLFKRQQYRLQHLTEPSQLSSLSVQVSPAFANKSQLELTHTTHAIGVQHTSIENVITQSSALGTKKDSKEEGSRACSNYWCTSRLGKISSLNFQLCLTVVELESHSNPLSKAHKRCQFRRPMNQKPVALVSVPGSGNTWVRGLLEVATGVCTGSIYCDAPLVLGGFVGEMVKDSSVLVVKTHTSDAQWYGVTAKKRNIEDAFYASAIVLVRSPFDTIVSERHRFVLREEAFNKYIEKVSFDDNSHQGKIGLEHFCEFILLTDKYIRFICYWRTS